MPFVEPLPIVWQKRMLDITASSVLLLVTSPLFVLFSILLFLEHALRGKPFDPLFYRDTRISRGTLFTLYKFNIFDQRAIDELRANNEFIHTKELEWAGKLTTVGKVLRQIYMDELPQLFNVLRGNMSLVGPRPLNPKIFERVSKDGVHPIARIQGGMTGNYQSYKNTRGKTASELDAYYIAQYEERSGWRLFFLDLKILLRTLKVLLRAQGV